mgnify:CR=1 FL=1|jgi:hypothetical protein|tara:strand:+ start:8345 stop:9118 length:774 start_codon:yes stop_codon:yes gene_type:complete
MDNKKILLFTLSAVLIGILIKNISIIQGYTSFLYKEHEYASADIGTQVIYVSSTLSVKESRTVNKSAGSAIKILSKSSDGVLAASTGTVFSHDDKYYVVTVAHGIIGDCSTTIVWSGGPYFTPCSRIVIIDHDLDYSIMVIDKPIGVTPVKLKPSLPRSGNNRATTLQNKTYYTGFPNSVGPLTISGRIVGFLEKDYVIIHSYAWSGASGSGVFASDGTFIGIIKAVDVGQTVYGVDVLEDIVVVLLESRINWDLIL